MVKETFHRWIEIMSKKVLLMLLATFALAACESSKNIDQNQLDRENQRILRQLGSD